MLKESKTYIAEHPRMSAYLLGLVIAIIATALETLRQRYMNYLVFTDSTLCFWNGINPYTQVFVNEHGRYFLYTPVFSVLYLPIALLPKWLGPFVWNLGNYTLFTLSIFSLPKQFDSYKIKIFLFLLLILEQSVFPFQFNIVVAYCFLFSFTLLERGKGFWAVLLIMISTTTKVYGIVELLLLFCYQKPFRNFFYAFILGILLLILPALKVGFDGLITCYENWWYILSQHQSEGSFRSLLYTFPLNFVLSYYRIIQLATIIPIIVLFFCKYKKWNDFVFRCTTLAILMGWIIVLGDSSESHTYLIALSGYILWFYLQTSLTLFDKIIFWSIFIFLCIVPIDILVPTSLFKVLNGTLYIDVYLYALAWIRIVWSLFHEKKA